MEVKADRPSCPFCAFTAASDSQNDMYFLMQHLELSHPENGVSPFIAVEDNPQSQVATRSRPNSATSSSTASEYEEEDVYVQCPAQCGESVTLAELSSHMELHGAEDMASFDVRSSSGSRDSSPQPFRRRSSSAEPKVPPSHSLSGNGLLAVSYPARSHSPSTRKRPKDSYGLKNLKELFLGPAPKKPRIIAPKPTNGGEKRLGVCLFLRIPSSTGC